VKFKKGSNETFLEIDFRSDHVEVMACFEIGGHKFQADRQKTLVGGITQMGTEAYYADIALEFGPLGKLHRPNLEMMHGATACLVPYRAPNRQA
jgi:hypothetical protein